MVKVGCEILLILSFLVCLEAGLKLEDGSLDLSIKKQDNCTYRIIIETTCAHGAGTTDNISVRFGDEKSNDILSRHIHTKHSKLPSDVNDVPSKPFQKCATNAFQITAKCITSHICYFYLKQEGEDSWRPGRAQVLSYEHPNYSSNSFYFRRVLPRNIWHGHDMCPSRVTPFGIRKERKAFTPKLALKLPFRYT